MIPLADSGFARPGCSRSDVPVSNESKDCEAAPGRVATVCTVLATKLQFPGQGDVTLRVRVVQVIKQTAPLADHLEQPPSGTVVLVVVLEMLGELVDSFGQQRDLYIRRTRVPFVESEILYGCRFRLHDSLLSVFVIVKRTN